MLAKVKTINAYMEELAPSSIALSGDPVGLQLGHPEREINKIMVALDPGIDAVEEAGEIGAEMLVTHHPLFYNQFAALNESSPTGYLAAAALRKGMHIFCAHTNYDIAPRGVSYRLAETLGLPADHGQVVEITGNEQLLKLVVFVPAGHEGRIRDAIAEAGAGKIGGYSHCTFQVPGTGTFMPGGGTDPYIGSQNKLEKVEEMRMETILPATRKGEVIKALNDAHPYEEVAYDLYPLVLEGGNIGLGLYFDLGEPLSLEDIINKCKVALKADSLRCWDAGKKIFSRVAVCGGSGGSLIEQAARQEVEILISGDFRYHDLKLAQSYGLALVDAGHDATEWPGVAYIRAYLDERLKRDGFGTGVCLQTKVSPGWK